MMMRTLTNICSLTLVLTVAVTILGCGRTRPVSEEITPVAPSLSEPEQRFDPLDLRVDREIVPEGYPLNIDLTRAGAIITRDFTDTANSPAAGMHEEVPLSVDTANNQSYRVQLLTSKTYGEARRAVTVAEEIFGRPVYLDYEVPYFKVRVGSFQDKYQAEDYLMRARAAGYKEAWVVVTNVAVRETTPLYIDELFPFYDDTLDDDSYPDPIPKPDDEPVTDD